MPETAKRTARVPILGEDGRISDDYIPAAIGEGVESAEAAAKRAETAATNAEGSASAASQSATQAASGALAASASATKAQESATTAGGAVTQAQSAQQAAEAAKTAAEKAQSAAAGSAQDAHQSATAAAGSAASVADKFIASAQATTLEPGSQATASVADQVLTLGIPRGEKGDKGEQGDKGDTGTGVPDGGTPGQLLSKTDSGTAWVDPPSGNVLKGTLGPAPLLSADDAYSTKPRKLTVNGETRQNLWVNPSGTAYGITATSNANGSLTMSGTSTASAYPTTPASYILCPGTQYTLSMSPAPVSGLRFQVLEQNADGEQTYHSLDSTHLSNTFTAKSDTVLCIMRAEVASVGTTVSGTYRVMLNEGSEPEPWCPPGLNSVDELSIVTAGKNLLDISTWTKVGGAAQLTVQPDGSWKCDGYPTSASSGFVSPIFPPGSYRADVSDFTDGAQVGLACSVAQSGFFWNRVWSKYGCEYLAPNVSNFTFVSSVPFRIGIMINSARYGEETQPTIYVYNPQLELGSTATAYEPPTVTTTPIDLDGNTLCSLPDGTHDELTIDATGAVTLTKRTQRVQLDGDGSWFRGESPYVYYNSPWSNFNGLPSGFVNRNHYVDKLLASSSVPNSLYSANTNGSNAYVREPTFASDAAGVKTWMGANTPIVIMALLEPQTIPLPSVTLPTLPAPTVNVWADAEESDAGYAMDPDVELEYERDINIAFNKLQAQISATTVREATNG